MKVPKPFFISRLQCGARCVAIINMVLSGITLFSFIELIILVIQDEVHKNSNNISLAVIHFIFGLIGLANLIVSVLLLFGAAKKNKLYCWIWLIVVAVSFVLHLPLTITEIVFRFGDVKGFEIFDIIALLFRIFWILLVLWEMWVVYAFIDELNRSGNAAQSAICGGNLLKKLRHRAVTKIAPAPA